MGNIQFRDNKILFVANKIAMDPDCCCDAECEPCQSSGPASLDVTFSGVLDDACSGCNQINDTWNVPFDQDSEASGVCQREWFDTFTVSPMPGCSNGIFVQVYVLYTPATQTRQIQVRVGAVFSSAAVFQTSAASPFSPHDCDAFDDLDIPFASDPGDCDFSSATCTLNSP